MFTFGVLTFNQEKIVLETLESIKFQILNFGEKRSIQLIIADDGSNDNTVSVIDYWIEKNQELFEIIKKIYSNKNKGISQNYVDAVKEIKGDNYKIIAGDDIFSKNNVFEIEKKLENYDFHITGTLIFKEYCIEKNKKRYEDLFVFYDAPYRKIRMLYKFFYPFYIQGVSHKVIFFDDRLLKFIESFKMVEDRPELYWITEKNKNLKFCFSVDPIILYRETESSVTRTRGSINKLLKNDLKKLYQISKKSNRNIFIKYLIWCSLISIKESRFVKVIKYINPFCYYKKLLEIKNRNIIDQYTEMLLDKKEIEENQRHIKYIKECADNVYIEFSNQNVIR